MQQSNEQESEQRMLVFFFLKLKTKRVFFLME